MGVYLSSPVTEKESTEGQCESFIYGASSMQGWRISQEDAHNCIPLFDEKTKTSFFAVYDGHGGSEVAKYCEKHFPEFVKKLMEAQDGTEKDLVSLIKNAFLEFDATLTDDNVIKELKELAGDDDNNDEEEDDDPVGRSETELLKEEANMPLDQLLALYKSPTQDQNQSPLNKGSPSPVASLSSGSTSKAGNSKQDTGNGPSSFASSLSSSSPSLCRQGNSSQLACDTENVNNSHTTDQSQVAANAGKDVNNKHPNGLDNNVDDAAISSSCNHISSITTASSSSSLPSKTKQEAASNHCDLGTSSSLSSSSSGATQPGASASVSSSSEQLKDGPSSSGTSFKAGDRSSKAKAAVDIANLDGDLDTSDDEDDEEEDVWEDASDEDDDDDSDEDEGEQDEGVPMMNSSDEEPGSDSGCTACVVLMQGKRLIVANAGDSRCVLSRAGTAVDLSFDHKPEDDPERERIEKAGGKVTADGRVNGGLNLSRALGDHIYKCNKDLPPEQQMITALPDVETAELSDEDQFLVIACDGIWNYMSSQEVVDFVLDKLKDPEKRQKPSKICEELFDHCLAPNTHGDGTGCDNMTCIIVLFKTFINSMARDCLNEAANIHKVENKISENSLEQTSGINETGDAGSGNLKRCVDDVDVREEKRLKVNEEVV